MKITCNRIMVGLENSTILNSTNVLSATMIDAILPTGRMADKTLAKDFAKLFNYNDGTRAVNFFGGFNSLRQCLGDSFSWALGLIASDDLKLRIGCQVSDKIKEFLGGKTRNGVRVMRRICLHGLYQLEDVSSEHHAIADCYGRSIVVPTGELSRSQNFAGLPIYVRLDVEGPTDDRSLLSLKRILLCSEDGYSICGLAAITDYIENLPAANSVFTNALGVGYDVLNVNARLFETWAWHTDNGMKEAFCVDLGVCDIEGHHASVWFDGCEGKYPPWRLSLDMDDCKIPFGKLAGQAALRCDICAVVDQWKLARNTLHGMSPAEIEAAVDYEHCIGDHAERFGIEFGEVIRGNPTDAIGLFQKEVVAAVERFKQRPVSWPVALFHGGKERSLKFAGDASASKIQLLAPLYLTQTDKENLTPTVYLCTGVNVDTKGTASVFFPSVLEASDAEMDNRFFRRMLRQSLGFDAYYAKAV